MKSIGVYPGSFDPITKGHVDIIKRSAKLVDRLVIGVLNNANKKCWFTPEERKILIEKALGDINNIEVKLFDGLLVDFMQQNNANLIIRCLRSVSDYEYELQLALGNKTLADFDLETIFIPASKDYLYLSSSIVREVACHGGNLEKFVNAEIIEEVKERAKEK